MKTFQQFILESKYPYSLSSLGMSMEKFIRFSHTKIGQEKVVSALHNMSEDELKRFVNGKSYLLAKQLARLILRDKYNIPISHSY